MLAFPRSKAKIQDVQLMPYGKRKSTDVVYVKLDDIDYASVKFTFQRKETDYMPIDSIIWQILGMKGQVRVCYLHFGTSDYLSSLNDEMILLSGTNKVSIPFCCGIHTRTYYLRQFINKRNGKEFQKSDLKNQQDVANYILDNEHPDSAYRPEVLVK